MRRTAFVLVVGCAFASPVLRSVLEGKEVALKETATG